MEETKKSLLQDQSAFQDKRDTLRQLADSLNTLRRLQEPEGLQTGPSARWRPSQSISVDMSRQAPHVKKRYKDHLGQTIKRLTRSHNSDGVYDELEGPASSDWMVVCSWILDRMYLAGLPAHYLIPDPTYLPEESLRFFHIDRNWIDAMIDGALSVANHLPNDQNIRIGLKEAINEYLHSHPEGLHYSPQLPAYGFLLRSHLCIKFPDLVVEAYSHISDVPDPTIIIRQENITEGVLLVMFDKRPGSLDFTRLILREPPHQQAFSCARELTKDSLVVDYKKIYTIPLEEQAKERDRTKPIESRTYGPNSPDTIFLWEDEGVDVSTLLLPAYAQRTHDLLLKDMDGKYAETDPTATLLGIQLNAPMRYIEIKMDPGLIGQSVDGGTDDGMLVGLKMLKPATRETSDDDDGASQAEDSHVVAHASPIDWKASFKSSLGELEPEPEPETMSTPLPAPIPVEQEVAPMLPVASPMGIRADSKVIGAFAFSINGLWRAGLRNIVEENRSRQELVFNLPWYGYGDSDSWKFKRIEISIPYGVPTEERPTLMDKIPVPGPIIAADFRFNVASTIREEGSGGERTFHLTIVPRAKWVYMKNISDLTVLLQGMRVAIYPWWWSSELPEPVIPVSITETYEDHVKESSIQVTVKLLKPLGSK